jgi:hypothetical protein
VYAGHIGIALGAKGIKRSVALSVLIVASQLPDWADAGLCLAGVTSATPGMLSHSFPAIGTLAVGIALAYMMTTRDTQGALFVGAVTVSHALADYVTGLKPTWAGGPTIGLQLYRYPAADFVVEAVVVCAGWLVYRASFPPERQSSRDLRIMLGVLLALQLAADIVFSMTPGLRKC